MKKTKNKQLSIAFCLFLILLSNLGCSAKKQREPYKLFIAVCSSPAEFELDGSAFCYSYGDQQVWGQALISDIDLNKLYIEFDSILQNPDDEIWIEPLIADGITLQLFIGHESRIKKIHIENFLELRFNRIALILNKYMPQDLNHHYHVPYGITDSGVIEELLGRQKLSPPDDAPPVPEYFLEEVLNGSCFSYSTSHDRVYKNWYGTK